MYLTLVPGVHLKVTHAFSEHKALKSSSVIKHNNHVWYRCGVSVIKAKSEGAATRKVLQKKLLSCS